MTPMSVDNEQPYLGREFSISQLLYATKKKLQGATFGGRIATTLNQAEVTAIEQDALEVLSLVRSMRNTFAPINRIPPEVFSIIPDYWGHRYAEQGVITLTHVCHGWREILYSRPFLWTHLDCKDADKTRVYIERSRSLPLKISLEQSRGISYCNDALFMAVPHTNRLSSLTICVLPRALPDLLNHFPFPAPLLKELKIIVVFGAGLDPILPNTIFPEHFSPLRKLSLSGVVTQLPWRNLSNLTVFRFRHVSEEVDPLFVTQLLDFFESAPLLSKIALCDSIPTSSGVPPGRVIPLLNLKRLTINELPVHSTFLDHLSIPTGASLNIGFTADDPPIPVCLSNNFDNLLHITTICLCNGPEWKRIRLYGPSGSLHMGGIWDTFSSDAERQFFQSLGTFDLSKTQRLAVTKCSLPSGDEVENSLVFQTLLFMNDLRTLVLIEADNLSFIHALNPTQNKSQVVLCSKLEELVLYIRTEDRFYLKELAEMASERAARFSMLSSIEIVSLDKVCPRGEVFALRKHVRRVEYKLDVDPPRWCHVFDDRDDSDYDSEWDISWVTSDDEDNEDNDSASD